jgi:DNA sulfur modification protein DndD
MATKLRIVGWKIQGFRCPDHALDFTLSRDETYDISLVQMPNGTGKTTTLELLKMTLAGTASQYSPEELRAFGSRDTSTGTCAVTLSFEKKLLTIILRIDLSAGSAAYKTTWGSGQQNGFHVPVEIAKFLNSDFINYFILDGELAQQLLSNKQAAAQRVIDAMFQADTLKKVSQRVEQYWHSKASDKGATTPQGFTRRKNAVEELEGLLKLRQKELSSYQAELKRLTVLREKHLDTFESEIRDGRFKDKALAEADDALQRETTRLEDFTSDVFAQSAHPFSLSASFADACLRLKSGLDRVKLPEAAAREFFEELCDEPDCICGRPIDPNVAKMIRARASQYLGADDVSLLNSIKTAIDEELPGKDVESLHSRFEAELSRLVEQVVLVQACDARFNELKVRAGDSDPAVKTAIQTIEDLREKIANMQTYIDVYTDMDEASAEYNPIKIKKRLEKAKLDLAEIWGCPIFCVNGIEGHC